MDDATQPRSPVADDIPPGESVLVWLGACALAAARHPNACYPQPDDVEDARTVLMAAARHDRTGDGRTHG